MTTTQLIKGREIYREREGGRSVELEPKQEERKALVELRVPLRADPERILCSEPENEEGETGGGEGEHLPVQLNGPNSTQGRPDIRWPKYNFPEPNLPSGPRSSPFSLPSL